MVRWRRAHPTAFAAVTLGRDRATVAIIGLEDAPELVRRIGHPSAPTSEVALVVRSNPERNAPHYEVCHPPLKAPIGVAAFATIGELVIDVSDRLEQQLTERCHTPLLHAGAVVHAAGGVIVAGPSRAGKSTMTAVLASLPGSYYVTDELVTVLGDGTLSGLARPLHVRGDVVGQLDEQERAWVDGGRFWTCLPEQTHRRPFAGALVVILHRDEAATDATLVPIAQATTARELLANSVNLSFLGWDSFTLVVQVAATTRGYRASYGRAGDLVARITDLPIPERHDNDPRQIAAIEIPGRQGRMWAFHDSILVVAGDRRRVVSLTVDSDTPSGINAVAVRPEVVRDSIDALLEDDWW